MAFIVTPLAEQKRGAFSCPEKTIQNFFHNNAKKAHQAYRVRVFIGTPEEDITRIMGFYALTVMAFEGGIDDRSAEKFGAFTIPTIYLTMIARCSDNSEPGFGNHLMENAFRRCLDIRENAGIYALTLHAVNEKVAARYESFGFRRFAEPKHDREQDNGDRHVAMFIPLEDVRKTIEALG